MTNLLFFQHVITIQNTKKIKIYQTNIRLVKLVHMKTKIKVTIKWSKLMTISMYHTFINKNKF